jgi:hypothetical protein
MKTIEELFDPHTATASGFANYGAGDIAYVTNGFGNNGVLGFVKPKPKDHVFDSLAIVLSAFCEATVQILPFIARGNGGSGLIVLTPKQPVTAAQLGFIAAYINTALKWRFSWSRQATVERIRRLEIPELTEQSIPFDIKELLPKATVKATPNWKMNFRPFALNDLFELSAGDYHDGGGLPPGDIPLISCGEADNGITRFVSVPQEHIYNRKLTISFNGMNTLATKYHPYDFATKDDVAICNPRKPRQTSTLVFIQLMMAREQWRYSYYRKCFMEKLKQQSVMLPAKGGDIDENTIETIMASTSYWDALKARLAA